MKSKLQVVIISFCILEKHEILKNGYMKFTEFDK